MIARWLGSCGTHDSSQREAMLVRMMPRENSQRTIDDNCFHSLRLCFVINTEITLRFWACEMFLCPGRQPARKVDNQLRANNEPEENGNEDKRKQTNERKTFNGRWATSQVTQFPKMVCNRGISPLASMLLNRPLMTSTRIDEAQNK